MSKRCEDQEHVKAVKWAMDIVVGQILGYHFYMKEVAVDISKKLHVLTGQVWFVEEKEHNSDDFTFPPVPKTYFLVVPLCPECHAGLQIEAGEVVQDLKISNSSHHTKLN